MSVPEQPDTRLLNVLFVCTGNAGRSIMAEAILRRAGGGRFRAFSAGSHPKGVLHPGVVDLLERRGFEPDRFRSKSWEEFVGTRAPRLDLVVTVCSNAAGVACPVWPGGPVSVRWEVPDPAAQHRAPDDGVSAWEAVWDLLERRIGALCALPVEVIDRRTLQRSLAQLG